MAGEKDESVPDWLQEFLDEGASDEQASEEITPAENSLEDEESPAPAELPDWLTGSDSASEETEAEDVAPSSAPPASVSRSRGEAALPETPATPSVPEPAAEGELPDWLSELSQTETAPAAGSAEDSPDWLRDLAPVEDDVSVQPQTSSEDKELPDWLREVASAPTTEPEPEPEVDTLTPEAEERESPPAATETPAPFSDTSEVEDTVTPDDLPDWLAGLDKAQTVEPESDREEVTPSVGAGAENEEELPDWLADLEPASEGGTETPPPFVESSSEKGPAPVEAEPAPAERKALEEPVSPPAEGDVPDWLQNAAPAAAPTERPSPDVEEPAATPPLQEASEEEEVFAEEEELPPEMADTDIPEWLQQLGPSGQATVSEQGPPAEVLEQADVPGWLQNLRPPGTGPLPSQADLSDEELARAAEKGLEQAEIPDWVQSLRPSEDATGGSLASTTMELELPPLEVSEEEGPLAGVQGILQARTLVDVPSSFEPTTRYEVPESIVEDAQLWQHLLEQPRGGEHVVTTKQVRPRWSETVLRVLVFILISLVALASFWQVVPSNLTTIPEPAPGVVALQERIASLDPGDTGVVAFEYGPAEAGEMRPLAETVLAHLLEQEVRIIGVGSLPMSAPMIQEHLEWAEEEAALETGDLRNQGYLPGGVSGIAQFLGGTPFGEPVDLLLVLSARSDRLRWWVEQNVALGEAGWPMGVVASASSTPFVRPYLSHQRMVGWMEGVVGAAAYWQLRGVEDPSGATLYANALTLTQWGGAAIILVGSLYALVTGGRKREV